MADAPRSAYWKEFVSALPASPLVTATPNHSRSALPQNNVTHMMSQQYYADHYTDQERQANGRQAVLAGAIPKALDVVTDMVPHPSHIGRFLLGRAIDAATGDVGENATAATGNQIKETIIKPKSYWDERNQYYQNAYQQAASQFPKPNDRLPPALPPQGVPMNPGRYMQREALHPFNWNDYVPSPSQQANRYS